MKVKAMVSFSGIVSMAKGQELEIKDKVIYEDLLNANYIEEIKEKSSKKTVKTK